MVKVQDLSQLNWMLFLMIFVVILIFSNWILLLRGFGAASNQDDGVKSLPENGITAKG